MRKNWPWQSLLAVAFAASSVAWAQAGAPVTPPSSQDNETSNTGPSPRDQPNPGLRVDPRIHRLPSNRGGNDNGSADQGAQGDNDGANNSNGAEGATPGDVRPQNPAIPQTPIFPANPPPPADPGQPGNPVTPTTMRLA